MFSRSLLVLLCAWTVLTLLSNSRHAEADDDLMAIATRLQTSIEEHFSTNRNHEVNPTNKDNTINYIKEELEGYGLEVELMEFAGENNAYEGTNVIGVLPGKRKGTAADNVLVLGSHFDTVRTTPGVNDNGSGMAVFLEAIKLVISEVCRFTNTVVFVAFDLEETQPVGHGLIGSDHFVQDWLAPFLVNDNGQNSTFQGAVVLETLMNFNATDNSQVFPPGMDLAFPELYSKIEARNFPGDFVTVVGRAEDDATLMSGFTNQWKTLGHGEYFNESVPLPFTGVPTEQDRLLYRDFFRSDHTSFWRYEPDSFKAIFLTDTANFRGNMMECYHQECDDVDSISDEKMLFLAKTTRSVANMIKELGVDNLEDTCISGSTEQRLTPLVFLGVVWFITVIIK
ncbi:uncharacterized protein YfbL-like isoform X2 [Ptychodera flava]|uniref:uncharacterized protein YfbL-like isoform X2 n=1 Tax=Ptychodera flava TaxID=63121 RepID=UPI00396A2B0A